ncbi:MAG: heavy metal translocating P-type ATPase [Bacillota bacterium]|jgi:Cd2+/Zn2+-exporting ATPase
MTAKVLLLKGLDCPHCGSVIENSAKNLEGVRAAELNLLRQQLKIDLSEDADSEVIIKKITDLVASLEPEVEVSEMTGGSDPVSDADKSEDNSLRRSVIKLLAAALIYAGAILWQHYNGNNALTVVFFLLALLTAGGEVILTACKNIVKGRVFDENFLMSLATIGAFAISDYKEGVAVMLFYQVGELFQSYAVGRSRKSISSLMDIRPDYANLKVGDDYQRVNPETVQIGDIIQVRAGEKIPLDGVVLNGFSMVDTSALTGESVPRDISSGSDVLSGCINLNGVLEVRVTKVFGESTVMQILDLVENATGKKSRSENFITRFARYYTPVVVVCAILLAVLPPVFVPGEIFSDWLYRALVFLVVSCPCALVISVPLGFFGGIGGASRLGVLVKGSNYLENLSKTDTIVFDKTGTLTKGVFEVNDIYCEQLSGEDIVDLAAHAECFSSHPIAVSLRNALFDYKLPLDEKRVSDVQELAGFGLSAKVDGKQVLVGNERLMKEHNIKYTVHKQIGTTVFVAADGEFCGQIVISDKLKEDAKAAVDGLHRAGVKNLVMLTGDNEDVAAAVCSKLGIDSYYAELLPGDKVKKVEALLAEQKPERKLAFVGDGINDAPVLARADIGIAMGGLGSDAAIEAADVVLMNDEPSKILSAIKISQRTLSIVKQNIVFALTVKFLVLILAAFGIASMWLAVFADVGVAFLAILNAMRALSVRRIDER